jgi:hypothetical protein
MALTPAYRIEELHLSSDRSFGVVVSIFFALVAVLPLLSGATMRYWALAPTLLFGLFAIINPSALHRANIVWARFGMLIQRIINPVILAILFYAVLVPFGMVVRMCRKDLLQLNFNPQADSYWIRPEKSETPTSSMVNQF